MDPLSIIGIIVGLATIVGVIVQIIHYFDERREKKLQRRQSNEAISSSANEVLNKSTLSREVVGREKRLKAVRIQLLSALPSDVWRGIHQVHEWLQENLEDEEVYRLLLDVIGENPALLHRVQDILVEMIQKGSKLAAETMRALPESVEHLLADADDAYYISNYDEAIHLYILSLYFWGQTTICAGLSGHRTTRYGAKT